MDPNEKKYFVHISMYNYEGSAASEPLDREPRTLEEAKAKVDELTRKGHRFAFVTESLASSIHCYYRHRSNWEVLLDVDKRHFKVRGSRVWELDWVERTYDAGALGRGEILQLTRRAYNRKQETYAEQDTERS